MAVVDIAGTVVALASPGPHPLQIYIVLVVQLLPVEVV